ncbi:uncharacterized protein LOC124534152 [Vanessa cardui]|uniref:uncharacterized protein LOC124534152 n=1 Tax=Vanessa cardui TaxID=171605 RepID=UPI001F129EAD|nr:uncharacterized protein LOC124534152 [Vanessa cardui]
MRRGQFHDKPDLSPSKRRMGDEEDVFPFNLTDDYKQEVQSNDEVVLSDKWMQDQDTKKYAEKLTKYIERPRTLSEENQESARRTKEPHYVVPSYPSVHRLHPTQQLFMTYPTFSTKIWQSGTSEIIMRMFDPVPRPVIDSNEDKYYDSKVHRALGSVLAKPKKTEAEDDGAVGESLDVKLRPEDSLKRLYGLFKILF